MLFRYKNKFVKNILTRSKATLLLLLIFISVVTTLPILGSTDAGAYTQNNDLEVIPDQITSFLYYQAISWCFANSTLSSADGDAINSNVVETGGWFSNKTASPNLWNRAKSVGIGVFLDGPGEHGDVYCSDATKLIAPALKLWGFSSSAELLCNIGFYRSGGKGWSISDCIKETALNLETGLDYNKQDALTEISENFKKFMKDNIFGRKTPALTGAQLYMFWRMSIQNSCIPDINSPPSYNYIDPADVPLLYRKKVNNDVQWVDLTTGKQWENEITKKPEGTYYQESYPDRSDTRIFGTPISSGGVGDKLTCVEAIAKMNKYIPDYLAWYAITYPPGVIPPKAPYVPPAIINPGTGGPATCSIDGIGWLICPVVRFLGRVADGAFEFLANNFLETSPGIFTNTKGTLHNAWSAMRNIANIAFVIVFLIIIFSQLTSVGITNYGIKKLLPRLIIAAILVNLSYYICQIAVDISNILGWSLKSFFENLGSTLNVTVPTFGQTGVANNLFYDIAVDVILLTLGGIIAYAALASFVSVALAAIVALVMILVILVARQALIILLIVISPVAFVAYLLPNTLPWFTKWQKAFVAMLMLFPIIGLVYGVSTLASVIITEVAQAGNNLSWFTQIAAAAVAVLPLFVVPGLLKKALDGVGTIGAKISGLGDKWGGAAGKQVGTWAGKQKEKSNAMADLKAFNSKSKRPSLRRYMVKRRARYAFADQNQKTELNRAQNEYVAGETETNDRFRARVSQGGGDGADMRALAGSKNTLEKLKLEEVAAAKTVIKNLSQKSIRELSQGGSADGLNAANSLALKEAAMQMTIASQDVEGINKLLDMSAKATGSQGGMDLATKQSFADSLAAAPNRMAYIGFGAISKIREGNGSDSKTLVEEAIKNNAYSQDKLATSSTEELEHVLSVAENMSSADYAQIKATADAAINNPLYSGRIAKQGKAVEAIQKLP